MQAFTFRSKFHMKNGLPDVNRRPFFCRYGEMDFQKSRVVMPSAQG